MAGDVGKKIWSRDMKESGIVMAESHRRCVACGYHSCYIVRWNDDSITKPCTKGVSTLKNGDLKID